MERHPVVAGRFYSNNPEELKSTLTSMILKPSTSKTVKGIIVPHAGYIFSGSCAGKVYGQINIPDSIILLGVNHNGIGYDFTVDHHNSWVTPLGDVEVDSDLRSQLLASTSIFKEDTSVGKQEHSLEVQIPFIRFLNPEVKILPITIASRNIEKLLKSGKELAKLIKKNPETLLVASTDMSHFISATAAAEMDQLAINEIYQLNPQRLLEVVLQNNISMCGVSPTTAMISALKELGANKVEKIEYTHSGLVTGDDREVVAYLGMMIS